MASLAAAFAANEDFSLYTIANHDHITRLPIEVKAHVIQHLSIGDLGRLAQTSAFFKDSITPIMYKRDNKEECPRAIFWAASVDPAGVYNEDVMTVLDLVIRYGGDLNKTYGSGAPRSFHATPLHLAAARGNLDVVKKLLNYGADPNALGQGFLYKMKPSLDHGKFDEIMEDINQTVAVASRSSLWRPLFVPFVLKNDEIIQALLRKGASPILAIPVPSRMRSAHEAGNINILHILASQKDREYRDPTGLSYFRRYSNLVNAPVPRGAAPLSMAMRHSNFNLIRDIIANGGDIEAVSEVGTTPLIQAITCFNKGKTREIRKEYMELIHYLVKSCNAGVGRHSDARVLQTPLTCAAMGFTNDLQYITWKNGIKDISSIINLLLDHGADVNERSDQGCSLLGALCWVISQRKNEKKDNKDKKKEDGGNPAGFLELFKQLVTERGADVSGLLPSGSSMLGACIVKFGREPLAFFQTLLELNAQLTPEEINPVFRMWVTNRSLRNTKPALNMLAYSPFITRDSIDFAYSTCLNGEDKIWDMLQSEFPNSTAPQKIAARALIQDANLKRFSNALRFKNFDGSYIHTDGNSFLHLIVKRLQTVSTYKPSQAVAHAKKFLQLDASIKATDKNGETALDKLMYMRMQKIDACDPLRHFLHDIEHGERLLWEKYQAKIISEEDYERRYKALIKLDEQQER
ncbi:uncharacterized protein TrAtP1_008353 [Trichoderma atroviride]|uniref:uncharacterized protein n=1 Tax=Hypocrea atroviridis TaxID=63577 RepID=UPI0033244A94|nr:hypothetical protein TrAtP1_008353 [Trichoderma atroviride]